MAVDYNDERLKNVESEKNKAIQETTNQYNQMINDSDKYYQAQIDAAKQYEQTQKDIQNQQTQLTIDQINQQKQKAEKDYQREQRGAYADYQKATGQYGVNEEQLAAQGLNRTGYSESTRTNAYNTYQNRYATARESYNNAVLNYDNGIKEAQLANSSALAQIAYQTLQTQLELSLNGFQYKNSLIQTRMGAVNEQIDRYNTRYQQVLSQMNTENALAEEIRQYNESMAFNREKEQEAIRQYNETMAFNREKEAQDQANWEKQYALSLASKSSGGGGGYNGYQLTDTSENTKNTKKTEKNWVTTLKENLNRTRSTKSTNLGDKYSNVYNAAKTLYTTGSGGAVEKFLATSLQNGSITEAGARKIIDELNK